MLVFCPEGIRQAQGKKGLVCGTQMKLCARSESVENFVSLKLTLP